VVEYTMVFHQVGLPNNKLSAGGGLPFI
jgi:hypothetical protein